SFGGRVIIKLANRQNLPFEIKKIILVDSAGILPKKTAKKRFKQRIFKLSKGFFSLGIIKKIFPNALENLRKKNGSADYNAASPLMRQTLVKVVNEDLENLLPTIKQSTLLIWGENDVATPLCDGQKMEQLIADSGLVTVKNAGHYSFLEQWYTVQRVLNSFLGIKN
ncbi:MAG: alpha/beta hydrolase, partial [Oscillospiraceae bacterium]